MTGPWVSAVFSDSFFDPLDFGEKRGAGNRAYTHVAHSGGGGGGARRPAWGVNES